MSIRRLGLFIGATWLFLFFLIQTAATAAPRIGDAAETPASTETFTPVETPTAAESPTGSLTETPTSKASFTPAPTNTNVPPTDTPNPTANASPSPSATSAPSSTPTPTPPPSATPTPIPGVLRGRVSLEGRADASGILIAAGNGPATTTNDDPNFALALAPGTYSITASKSGYCAITRWAVTVTGGQTVDLPPVSLTAGDTNGDGQVDVADLAMASASFGRAVEPGRGADINGDGRVDILDLVLIAANLGNDCSKGW